jgi:hypothetical protein
MHSVLKPFDYRLCLVRTNVRPYGVASEIVWSDTDKFPFVGFCDGKFLRPPAADNTTQFKTRLRETCANTDQEILHNVWQEVEYRFDVVRTTRGAYIELY